MFHDYAGVFEALQKIETHISVVLLFDARSAGQYFVRGKRY